MPLLARSRFPPKTPRLCNSSSSSCASSLMSPLSSSTAFRLLCQLPWCNLPQCVQFSHSSNKLGRHLCNLSLALFLLSCLRSWTTVPFQHNSLLFHLCRCSSISVHSNWDPVLRSIHLWLLFPCTLLALRVQMLFRALLRMLPHRLFLLTRRYPLVHQVHQLREVGRTL